MNKILLIIAYVSLFIVSCSRCSTHSCGTVTGSNRPIPQEICDRDYGGSNG